jgi:hypothetical protein
MVESDTLSPERRRRTLAELCALPPRVAARFTESERSALGVVACAAARSGRCQFDAGAIAAVAGVRPMTVMKAISEAQRRGLLRVDSAVVTLRSRSWLEGTRRVLARVEKHRGKVEDGAPA